MTPPHSPPGPTTQRTPPVRQGHSTSTRLHAPCDGESLAIVSKSKQPSLELCDSCCSLDFCSPSCLYRALPWSQNPLCILKTCLDLPEQRPISQHGVGHSLEQHGRLWCCSARCSESKHDFLRAAIPDLPPTPLLSLEPRSHTELPALSLSPQRFVIA